MTRPGSTFVTVALLVAATACSTADAAPKVSATTRPTVVTATTTSPTTVLPTTTTGDPVPVVADTTSELADYDPTPHPEPSPTDVRAAVPVTQIGTIRIPRINLVHPLYQGVWLTVIDEGPGHWPGSALPGERGNAVFPGHRVTHSHPFLNLDQLQPGDDIIFEMDNGTFTYRVRETMIVTPKDIWVVDQGTKFESTLIACHPKHSARQRIVIKSDLVKSELNEQGRSDAERVGAALTRSAL